MAGGFGWAISEVLPPLKQGQVQSRVSCCWNMLKINAIKCGGRCAVFQLVLQRIFCQKFTDWRAPEIQVKGPCWTRVCQEKRWVSIPDSDMHRVDSACGGDNVYFWSSCVLPYSAGILLRILGQDGCQDVHRCCLRSRK